VRLARPAASGKAGPASRQGPGATGRPTIGELTAAARTRLHAASFHPSPREALLLMGHVLGLSEAQVVARSADPLGETAARRFAELLGRRLAGEPYAYLTGEREFYGRRFLVDRRVLIPRPETEHAVEAVLALELPARPHVLDAGTGSGCLAVTLALELPASRIVAGDLSLAALAVAAANVRRHGVGDRTWPAALDLTTGVDLRAFDLVVSNPPYVARADAPLLSPEVRDHEPASALFAPGDGTGPLARLIGQGRELRPGAHLVLEIGLGQLESLVPRFAAAGLVLERVVDDYAGIPRTVVLRRR
jgi:release factor glutamine methyltransferase